MSSLFFSEYVEGTGNNKALEIFNPTNAPVDLSEFQIEIFFNGSTSAGTTIPLSGTLVSNGVFVVADDDADPAILAVADLTSSANFFNGDDTIVLRRNGEVVDAIGQLGTDPGSAYSNNGVSTQNETLRRTSDVTQGDTNPNDPFDPSAEFRAFGEDVFDDLGQNFGTVVINEIIVSTASTDQEFLELFGVPGTSLDGFALLEVEPGGTIDTVIDLSGNSLGENGYFLLASPEAQADLGVTGNLQIADNTFTNNSRTYLLVEGFSGASGDDIDTDNDGTIDSAPWSAIADSVAPIDDDNPLIYSSNVIGPDGNFLAPGGFRDPEGTGAFQLHAFSDSSAYTPTAGAALPPPPPVSLVINEVLADPASGLDGDANGDGVRDAAEDEFIEIVNTGDEAVDLSGFTLSDDDGDDFAFAAGTVLAAGQALVLFGGGTPTGDFGGALVFTDDGSIGTGLSNSGDTVELRDAGGDLLASFAYGSEGSNNQSLTRNPDLTGAFEQHGTAADDGALFSPGTQVDGTPFGQPFVVINEVVFSHTGTDDTEFVELFGTPGASLDGLSLISLNANAAESGQQNLRIDFGPDDVLGENGFLLLGNPAGLAANYAVEPDIALSTNQFENDSQVFALIETASVGTGTPTVVDAVGFINSDLDYVNQVGEPVVGPDGPFLPAGGRRIEDGLDTDSASDWVLADFSLGDDNTPTPGSFDDPGNGGDGDITDDPTLISAIQGIGDTSPIVDQTVVVEAIVTGDFQNGDADTFRNLDGFYLQEEQVDFDADPNSSEGIFVFDGDVAGAPDVNEGDVVRVLGQVEERFGKTQIAATEVQIVTAGGFPDLASQAVRIALPAVAAREAFESMLVTIDEPLNFAESFDYEQFGEATLSTGGEIFQFTQLNAPSVSGNTAYQAEVADRTILIDDGTNGRRDDGDPILLPDGRELSSDSGIRMGQTINDLTGIFDFDFGAFRLRLPDFASFEPELDSNPRPEAPEEVGGRLKVVSYNVLNYFTTLDERGAETIPGFPDDAELERQRAKLIEAIEAMDADILGLVEIENNDGAALADLVAQINAALGEERYAAVQTGTVGTDAITTAFIYDQTTVSLVGDAAILDSQDFVAPLTPGDQQNRPAIAQTFEEIATGERFTAVVNHFKSKGSLTGALGDEDQGDGQGRNNATRKLASEALADWLETDPTGSDDPDVLILGDLNAYALEDPVQVLLDEGFTNLEAAFNGLEAASFRFSGQIGTLDYALANQPLLDQVTGATAWQINSDELFVYDYNIDSTFFPSILRPQDQGLFDPDSPEKNSDHDPIIIGLNLSSEPDFNLVEGTAGNDRLIGTAAADLIVGLGGAYDRLTGGAGGDIFRFSESSNGLRDRDVVTDFTVGEDLLDLDGAEVLMARTLTGGLLLTLDGGDGDSVYLLGVPGTTAVEDLFGASMV